MEIINFFVYCACLILALILVVAILFVAFAAVVYLMGYMYDCFFGNTLLRVSCYMISKFPNIKN